MHLSLQNTETIPENQTPTLFLPGWGFDGRVLQLLSFLPQWLFPRTFLDPATIEGDLLQLIAEKNIKKIRLIGWSMGAMLALEFAARHHTLVDSLVLVALRGRWPGREIKEIQAEFSRIPESFLQDFYRKCFLGDKKAYRDFTATLQPLYLAAAAANRNLLQHGLDYLGGFTIPRQLPDIPIRVVHGRQDIIAPLNEMPDLAGAEVEVVENAGHAVFLHEKSSLRIELKKQAIRKKFSRAADSYDNYAVVQAEIARRLAAKLPARQETIKSILEIGCGTGNFTKLLAERYPQTKIVALDFSPEMIDQARRKLTSSNIEFICAEGESFLAKAPGASFDLVASNGSLQWFADLDKTLSNMARTLQAGGCMVCAVFGPDSLKELGQGLEAKKFYTENLAARTFPNRVTLLEILRRIFQPAEIEEEIIEKQYRSVHDLLLHLKKTGTSGWQQKTMRPLTPSRVNQLDQWFRESHGTCKVTYQVFFLQGKK